MDSDQESDYDAMRKAVMDVIMDVYDRVPTMEHATDRVIDIVQSATENQLRKNKPHARTGGSMNTEQERAEFEAWTEKRGVWPRLTHQEIFSAGYQAGRAALQSPDIQERIRDGERLEWLAENMNEIEVYRSQRGWCVVDKGTTRSIVEDCKTLRGALDAAMFL